MRCLLLCSIVLFRAGSIHDIFGGIYFFGDDSEYGEFIAGDLNSLLIATIEAVKNMKSNKYRLGTLEEFELFYKGHKIEVHFIDYAKNKVFKKLVFDKNDFVNSLLRAVDFFVEEFQKTGMSFSDTVLGEKILKNKNKLENLQSGGN